MTTTRLPDHLLRLHLPNEVAAGMAATLRIPKSHYDQCSGVPNHPGALQVKIPDGLDDLPQPAALSPALAVEVQWRV